MKKSRSVFLSAFFILTTTSCMTRREWIDGADEPYAVRDTVLEDGHYRYYRGGWFRVHHNNCMRVPYYMSHSNNPLIAQGHGFPPGLHSHDADTHQVRVRGFGKSAQAGVAAHS